MDFTEESLALENTVGPADRPLLHDLLRQSEQPVKLTLESPARDLHLYTNPEMPPGMNTLSLRVTSEPQVGQVLWYVDGKPYRLAGPPYTVSWPMEKGHHTFQVRLPYRTETSLVAAVDVD